jgi:hypothetical protein
MAINPSDPCIHISENKSKDLSILLSSDIFQIICMNHTNNSPKLLLPFVPMVVPVEVFWLLKYCHISFLIRNALCYVTDWYNAPQFF